MIRPWLRLSLLGLGLVVGCGGETSGTDDTSNQAGGSAGSSGAAGSAAGVGGSAAGSGGVAGSAAGSGGQAGAGQGGLGGSDAGQGGLGGSGAGQGGNAAGSAGVGGGTGGAGGSITETGDIVGSYDLTFGAVKQDKKPFGNIDSPSPGTNARVDIRQTSGGGYEAIVTPRFRPPAVVTVQATAGTVVLDGPVMVVAGSGGPGVSDGWQTFTLARTPAGGLAGPVTLVGTESAYGGDVVDSTAISGVATVTADTTAPELRVAVSSPLGLATQMLPWGSIDVTASEGLPADALVASLQAAKDGQTLASSARLEPAPDSPDGWSGSTQSHLRLASWNLGGDFTAGRLFDMFDPTGNATKALVATLSVLAVPGPQTAHGFDTDVLTAQPWGVSSLLGGGIVGADDPLCEQGGCAMLGPMTMGYCADERAGLAVRVKLGAATTQIAVRFRVAAAQQGNNGLPPLGVRVDSLAGTTTSASSNVELVETGADDELNYVSAWSTLTVPVPAGAVGEVGVSLVAGTSPSCGFVPPGVKTRVLIESIAGN